MTLESSSPSVLADTTKESINAPTFYPYRKLLQQLEVKARQSQASAKDSTSVVGNDDSSSWNLSTDALLATLLHEFSIHVAQRTRQVSLEIQKLQTVVNKVGVDVVNVQSEWMQCSGNVAMEQFMQKSKIDMVDCVSDETNRKKLINNKDGIGNDLAFSDDDSAHEITRLEEEEQQAIQNGMKALSLFYDPNRPKKSLSDINVHSDLLGEEDDDLGTFDVEEGMIGENCYYYPCAEDDVFNQRPLPFIVGSREFMESSCAGLEPVLEK